MISTENDQAKYILVQYFQFQVQTLISVHIIPITWSSYSKI